MFGGRASYLSSWADLLGRASLTLHGNDLELIIFSSGDRLSFGTAAGSTPGSGTIAPHVVPTRFDWSTLTSDLVWKRSVGGVRAKMGGCSTEAPAKFELPPAGEVGLLSRLARSKCI